MPLCSGVWCCGQSTRTSHLNGRGVQLLSVKVVAHLLDVTASSPQSVTYGWHIRTLFSFAKMKVKEYWTNLHGLSGGTWTPGIVNPNHAFYQLNYTQINVGIIYYKLLIWFLQLQCPTTFFSLVLPRFVFYHLKSCLKTNTKNQFSLLVDSQGLEP